MTVFDPTVKHTSLQIVVVAESRAHGGGRVTPFQSLAGRFVAVGRKRQPHT